MKEYLPKKRVVQGTELLIDLNYGSSIGFAESNVSNALLGRISSMQDWLIAGKSCPVSVSGLSIIDQYWQHVLAFA